MLDAYPLLRNLVTLTRLTRSSDGRQLFLYSQTTRLQITNLIGDKFEILARSEAPGKAAKVGYRAEMRIPSTISGMSLSLMGQEDTKRRL
jgi:hypothetical protein